MTARQLEWLLEIAAAAQLIVSVVNLWLVRLLGWRVQLERLPLLMREVFRVHTWFISVTLTIFAVMTWRFASEMATGANAACVWLAALVAVFWGFRTVLQMAYYSASHWRGKLGRTAIHVTLLVVYGGMALVYGLAAAHGR